MIHTLEVDSELRLTAIDQIHPALLYALVDQEREHLKIWLPWVDSSYSPKDSREYIEANRVYRQMGTAGIYGIKYRSDLVGIIGFNTINSQNKSATIGYWLKESAQGKGLMTRSLKRLLRYAYDDRGLNRLAIAVAVENLRSQKIPEALGFRLEGIQREAEWLHDHFVDHKLYSILRSEWLSLHVDHGQT